MSTLSRRIRHRRETLQLTRDDLAEVIQKDPKQIWRYETDKSQPTAPVLLDLAMALKTSSDYLLGMTDDPERPLRTVDDLTNLEQQIIKHLRDLSPDAGKRFLDFLEVV